MCCAHYRPNAANVGKRNQGGFGFLYYELRIASTRPCSLPPRDHGL
jgi:hypothetical protein